MAQLGIDTATKAVDAVVDHLGRRLDPLDPQVGFGGGGSGRSGHVPPAGAVLVVMLGADDLHRPGGDHLLGEFGVLGGQGVQLGGESGGDLVALGLP